jgi:hypothetical protein
VFPHVKACHNPARRRPWDRHSMKSRRIPVQTEYLRITTGKSGDRRQQMQKKNG